MRFFALLPIVGAIAYSGSSLEARDVISNTGTGPILGIYALCGGSPVDCGSGYCCLNGQTCTTDTTGAIKCADAQLSGDPNNPAIVNAAYYGSMQSGQASASKGPMSTMTGYTSSSVTLPTSSTLPSSYSQPSSAMMSSGSVSSSFSSIFTNSASKMASSTGSVTMPSSTGTNISGSIQSGLAGGSGSGSGSGVSNGGSSTVQQVTTNGATSVQKSAAALVGALIAMLALL